MNKLYLYVINTYRIMLYVVIARLFDCVISVFAMFLYIYFGKNKNQYELFGIFFYEQAYSVILQKEYTSLKLRELEGLPRFGVMSWQPF